MTEENLPIPNDSREEQTLLKARIRLLKQELERIEQKTDAFEVILRSHLTDEIIEEQELTVLYKKLKRSKKEKRLHQKKLGKNFREPTGLKGVIGNNINETNTEAQKEKKRLYREAMLQVHPDKFSMNTDNTDLATEITTRLIEIYQSGDLEALQNCHTHIFSGNAMIQNINPSATNMDFDAKGSYLKNEADQLEKRLILVKSKHTYKVLTGYEDPLSFIQELQEYYNDRILKLRKRTRKSN